MKHELKLPFILPGLNDYINEDRKHRQKGAQMKKYWQSQVRLQIYLQLRGVKFEKPVRLHYTWVEKARRRDMDNISGFGKKVIQDALVGAGVLKDDGWGEILGFTDSFSVDKTHPGVKVVITDEES